MANEITLEQAKTLVKSGSLDGLGYNELAAVIRCLRDNSVGDPDAKGCLDLVTASLVTSKTIGNIAKGVDAEDYDAARYIALNDGDPFPFDEHQSVHTVLNQKMAERFKEAVAKHQDLESMQDLSFSELAEFNRLSHEFTIITSEEHTFVDNLLSNESARLSQVLSDKILINPQDFRAVDYIIASHQYMHVDTDKIREMLNEAISQYDTENNLEKADGKILEKNLYSMNTILDAIDIENPEVKNGILQDVFKVLNRVDITNDKGETIPADSEERKAYITNMFEAAKLDVIQANLGNANFLMTPLREKTELTINGLKDSMFAMLGQCGVASTFRALTEEELVLNSDEQKKYQEESAKAAENALDNLINGTERFNVSGNTIIAGCVEKEVDFNNFQSRVNSIFPYSKASPQLKNRLNKVSEFFSKAWGNRHEIMKNIITNVKDNKQMHISNISASALMALGTATGFGAIAIGSYAVYTAASSAVWPVLAEANKARRLAKEKGEKVSFLSSLKAAWKSVKSQKSYKTKVVTSCIAGGIGAAIGFGGMSMGLETFMQKAVASVARATGGVAAQTVGVIDAKREYKKNPTDENKAKLKSAKTSLAISGSIALIGSAFSVNRAVAANEVANGATTVTPDPTGNVAAADSIAAKANASLEGVKEKLDSIRAADADSLGTKTPVDSLGTKTPVDSLGTKTPVDSLGTKTPVDSLGTKTPVDSLGTKTPANAAATGEAEVPANSGADNIIQLAGGNEMSKADIAHCVKSAQALIKARPEDIAEYGSVAKAKAAIWENYMNNISPELIKKTGLAPEAIIYLGIANRLQLSENQHVLMDVLKGNCGSLSIEKQIDAVKFSASKFYIHADGKEQFGKVLDENWRPLNLRAEVDEQNCGEKKLHITKFKTEVTSTAKETPTEVPEDIKTSEDIKLPAAVVEVPTDKVPVMDIDKKYLYIPGQYGPQIAIEGSFGADGAPKLSGDKVLDAQTIWLEKLEKGNVQITRLTPEGEFLRSNSDVMKGKEIGVIVGAADKDGVLEGKVKLALQNYADPNDLDVRTAKLNDAVPSTVATDLTKAGRVTRTDGGKKAIKNFFMDLIKNGKSK